jgi:hypothetical protein
MVQMLGVQKEQVKESSLLVASGEDDVHRDRKESSSAKIHARVRSDIHRLFP